MDSAREYLKGAALTLVVGAGLTVVAIWAGGGQNVTHGGPVLAALVLAISAFFGHVAFTGRIPHPFSGFTTVTLLTAYALWVALSIGWSILPDDTYVDAGRTLAYVAVFAALALIAQLRRGDHGGLAGGLLLAAVLICGFALLSRIAPGWYSPADTFARLRAPFEYWNAVGMVAACGVLAAIWLGTRREADRRLVALSYPAGILLVTALLMSQSRGALLSVLVGIALWVVLAPRRLRTVGWLAVVSAISGLVVLWAFSQTALSQDHVDAALRASAGWKLAIVLGFGLSLGYLAGLGVEELRSRRPLAAYERDRSGKALLIALALSPVLLIGALTTTEQGAWGTISDSVSELTDSSNVAPPNTPGRFAETSSLRARYWKDSLDVWHDHKLKGTGADTFSVARLPYREDQIKVGHAHGFVPQTLADLGIVGLALAMAALVSWIIAALRALAARREAPTRWLDGADDRRNALVAVVSVATIFGIHSALDWTWFVPGTALFGMVAAGWVAGSARNAEVAAGRGTAIEQLQPVWIRAMLAAGVVAIGLATVLSIYRPARAADHVHDGYMLVAAGHPFKAIAKGTNAIDLDALADEPFYLIADAQTVVGRKVDAEKTLESIALRQPGNPDTWLNLAEFRLDALDDPEGALAALQPLFYLSPNSELGRALEDRAEARLVQQRFREAVREARAKYKRAVKRAIKRGAAGATNATGGN